MVKLTNFFNSKSQYYKIIEYESNIGGQLFGPIPTGHKRQFFCFNPYTWVWHEEWKDSSKINHLQTTYYHIRANTVVKSFGDQVYHVLDDQEYQNFIQATKLYCRIIPSKISQLAVS
jgi:hypothetical protein